MLALLLQIAGGLLMLAVLVDVFLTVLYARIGTGLFSQHASGWIWQLLRGATAPLGGRRGVLLAACGPAIVLFVLGAWIVLLILGAALVIYPQLGRAVQATSGPTPHDFATAVYVAGASLTTIGASDFSARTATFRLFYVFVALLGISLITLTMTLVIQIYNALQARNTFALKVHLSTAETGDAAELVAGLGAEGRFEIGYSHLAEMAAELTSIKEAQHFHSVLLYFRFQDPYYSVARFTLVTLDTVTLIKSALDDQHCAWLKESAAVAQLWRAAMRMLTMLAVAFLPGGLPETAHAPDAQTLERWRARYFAARRRLAQAAIPLLPDQEAGAQNYVALRARWDRYIVHFTRFLAHDMEQVDPAGGNPGDSDERQEFNIRLRSAG